MGRLGSKGRRLPVCAPFGSSRNKLEVVKVPSQDGYFRSPGLGSGAWSASQTFTLPSQLFEAMRLPSALNTTCPVKA